MKKIIMMLVACSLPLFAVMAQNIQEPKYIGEVLLLTSDSTAVDLEKKTAEVKSKAGISMKLTGFGSIKTHLHVEGPQSAVRIGSDKQPITLLVKVHDNQVEPGELISVFTFEKRKKERRAELNSVTTFLGASADNLNYVGYTAEQYGESCFIVTLEQIVPGELGILVNNPEYSGGSTSIPVRCLGID